MKKGVVLPRIFSEKSEWHEFQEYRNTEKHFRDLFRTQSNVKDEALCKKALTIFAKRSILDVSRGSEYDSAFTILVIESDFVCKPIAMRIFFSRFCLFKCFGQPQNET